MKPLKPGDKIRLKVRLCSGYKGTATVIEQEKDLVSFQIGADPARKGCCMRWECAKIRKK